MLDKIYGSIMDLRNFLYDGDVLDAVKVNRPVISVGNLTTGGSGKTPVVVDILQKLIAAGKKPVVIARNYRALSKGVQEVLTESHWGPAFFGDEAFMIKKQVPEAQVWTGPRKYETAQKAIFEGEKSNREIDVLVIDDGFQHRELNRDFDLLLLDASAEKSDWQLLPKGYMREDFKELKRADSIVLTKVNLATAEKINDLKEEIRRVRPDLFSPADQIAELEYQWVLDKSLQNQERVLLISGIAKPNSFLQTVKILAGEQELEIVDHLVFKDHHQYGVSDIDQIRKLKREYGEPRIITTEKDAVKFKELGWPESEYDVVKLQIFWHKESEALNEFLSEFLSQTFSKTVGNI